LKKKKKKKKKKDIKDKILTKDTNLSFWRVFQIRATLENWTASDQRKAAARSVTRLRRQKDMKFHIANILRNKND